MSEPRVSKYIIYRKEDWDIGATSYFTQLRELQINAHENPLLSNKNSNKRVFITSKYQRAYTKYNVNASNVGYLSQSVSNKASEAAAWADCISVAGSFSSLYTVNAKRYLGATVIASGTKWNASRYRMFIRFTNLSTEFSSLAEYLGLIIPLASHYYLTEEDLYVYQVSKMPANAAEAKTIEPIATIGTIPGTVHVSEVTDGYWSMSGINNLSGTFYLMIDRANWDTQPTTATTIDSVVYYPSLLRIDQGNSAQSTSGYWPKYCFDYASNNWELGLE
jgi:hypothetical protein